MIFDETGPAALPYIADRQAALEATRLLADHGAGARMAASARADISRDRGNVVDFCRWRQIERLISVLADIEGEQTRH
jgi:hypothetical protein